MPGFFDRRCDRGHRYGWVGDMADDPGCPKCRAKVEFGSSPAVEAPPPPSLDELIERARKITSADRDETLRRCVEGWLRQHGGRVS